MVDEPEDLPPATESPIIISLGPCDCSVVVSGGGDDGSTISTGGQFSIGGTISTCG